MLSLAVSVVLLAGSRCSTLQKSDSVALQGKWKGREVAADSEGPCYLIISGRTLEFRGANTNEWYKGTFSLREDTNPRQVVVAIAECSIPQYITKTSYGIYQIEDGTLTIAANEPGSPEVPPSFDAPGARRFVLKQN